MHTGKHVLVDVWNAPNELCIDDGALLEALVEGSKLAGMKVINQVRYRFLGDDTPPGCTCFVSLDSSHCSVHVYQDTLQMSFDFFTCGEDKDPVQIWEYIRDKFDFQDFDVTICDRFKSAITA